MKKTLLVILIVVIIGSFIGFINAECTDSDGGLNYYQRGSLDMHCTAPCGVWSDSCIDNKTLLELSCENINGERYTCDIGCEDGACIVGGGPTCGNGICEYEGECEKDCGNKSRCGDGICTAEEKVELCVEPSLDSNGNMVGEGGCKPVCPKDCPDNSSNINKGFKFVYWQCYDGTESESKEDSCKLSESWQEDANKFCDKKCNKDGSKCGVNSFSVSNECYTDEIINECNQYNLGNNFCSDTKTSTYCGIESVKDNGDKTYSFKNLTCYNGYCKEGYCIGSDTEVLIEKDIGTAKYVLTMPYEGNGMYIINYDDTTDNNLNPIQVWLSLGNNLKSKQWCQSVLKLALQGDKIKTPEGWNSGDYIDIPPGKVLDIDGNEIYQTNPQPVVFWISYGKCVEILNNVNQQVVKEYLKKYPSSCKDKTCLFEKEEPVERECIVDTNCCPVCGIDVPCLCYSKCISGKCIEASSEKRNCEDKGGLCIYSDEKCKEGYSISESSAEDCDAKSLICCIPNNIALTSSVLVCKDSCPLEDKCYPFGYRKDGKYCSDRVKFVEQLKADSTCENNFECSSNVCVSGKCIDAGFIQKILNWFKRLFGGK